MPVSFSWTVTVTPTAQLTGANDETAAIAGAEALRDLRLDPETGDLDFSEGDLVFVKDVEGICSDLLARLQTFGPNQRTPTQEAREGEYYLDTSIGFPWWLYLGAKQQRVPELVERLRAEALATPGIIEVPEVRPTFSGRQVSVTLKARASTGAMISVVLAAVG